MYYTLKLAFRNIFSRKSSFVIVLFITFAVTLLIVVNSIFDGTDNGIKTVFKDSFTGDLVIREKTKDNVSLFGNVSLIDESVLKTEEISFYEEITNYLSTLGEINDFTPQVSSFSLLEIDNKKSKAAVFGIDIENYLSIMNSINIVKGKAFENGEKGLLVSEAWAENFQKENKKTIEIETEVQLVYSDGNTFRIRVLPITGIYSYPLRNDILDKIVLADASTIRSLLGMNETYSEEINIEDSETNLIDSFEFSFEDMDSLFAEESDIFVEEVEETNINQIFEDEQISIPQNTVTNWHFIVVRLNKNINENSVIRKINKWADKNNYPIEAVNWRVAAGPTAQYVYWLRIVLIIGIFIILFAGLIVVTNTLVINILDRTKEIGTMRAIGANKRNIAFQCMSETFILTMISAFISFIVSFLIILILQRFPIKLNNIFLEQLFGGKFLKPQITISSFGFGFLVSLFIGLFSWIIPVIEALKILPVKAMKGGN